MAQLLFDIPFPEIQPAISGERDVLSKDYASDARRLTPWMHIHAHPYFCMPADLRMRVINIMIRAPHAVYKCHQDCTLRLILATIFLVTFPNALTSISLFIPSLDVHSHVHYPKLFMLSASALCRNICILLSQI